MGGAEVSLVHGNFVVNRDKASGSDVVNLVRKVRSEILHSKGIALEPEHSYGANVGRMFYE